MEQDDILNLLKRAGHALHGERWQVPLSRDLGVTDRTLRYWLEGINAVPAHAILPKLYAILVPKLTDLLEITQDIRKAIKP